MARSVSHAVRLVAVLSDSAGHLVARRGYSAATAPSAAVRKAEEKAVASTKSRKMGTSKAEPPSTAASSSWVPDPVTGYYRPANRTVDVDAAELRRRLLSRKPQH